MNIRFYILLMLLPFNIFAQSAKIKGVVEDKNTREKLPYVSVVLFKEQDSTYVKGVSTDSDGNFLFTKIANGNYYLTITSVGYEKYSTPLIEVTADKNMYNLGKISMLPSSIDLEGVEIVARRPFIEREVGKTIMNVESAPAGTGDNVWEMLKKVPGVTIENDSDVKLNGQSGVLILIDDRKTYLSGDALVAMLKNMPTLGIDKVEAITNPSEKYDAEGVGGILNIKMKKNNSIGVFGSVYGSIGYSNLFRHSEGIDLSARFKKFAVFGGISNNSYPSKYDNKGQLIYPDGTSFEVNMNDDERWLNQGHSNGQNYRFGLDYYFNTNNILGFAWRMSNNNSDNESSSNTRIKQNDIVDSSYSFAGKGENSNKYNVFNLNYKHVFDSAKTEFTMDFDYSFNKSKSDNLKGTGYYSGDFSSLERNEKIEDLGDSKVSVISFKADLEHSFSKKLKFTSGAKVSFVTNDNDVESYDNEILTIERTNHFVYDENIAALYAGLGILFSQKTSMRLGLRGEYTFTKGFLENIDSTNKQQYFNLFPSVTFRQQLGKINELEFMYRYHIRRPNYSNLNPFLYRSNQYSYYSGNPDLKPQYTQSLGITHILKHMIFTTVNYSYSKDQATYMVDFDPEKFISISRPQNIGKTHSIWFSINGNIPIFKWWYCSVSAGAGWNASQLNYGDSLVKNTTFNSQIWMGQYFTITKGLTAELSGWFSPKSTNANFSTVQTTFSLNAGVRQTLLKDRLSIRLSVNDIFNTAGKGSAEYNYPNGIVSKMESKWGSRFLWLTASYSFGKQEFNIRQRKTASEEEQGRIGGGESSGK